jgi:hypothetical protein
MTALQSKTSRILRRRVLSGFIVFHLTALFVISFPGSSPVRTRISLPFRRYFEFFNLWQNWGMFAPEPSNLNAFLRAVVKTADGETRSYDFPRMSELGFIEKYQMERYRKWAVDGIRADSSSAHWPAAARFIARRLKKEEGLVVVEVQLWRFWTLVEAPEVLNRPLRYRIPESELSSAKFFTLAIHPEDI